MPKGMVLHAATISPPKASLPSNVSQLKSRSPIASRRERKRLSTVSRLSWSSPLIKYAGSKFTSAIAF